MRQIAVIAVFCLGLSARAWAEGPSFDCAKAATPVEKAICASGDLSALDRQIAEEYQTALSAGQTNTAEQRAWLVDRNKACAPANTTDCLRQVMIARHEALTQRPEGDAPPSSRGNPSFNCDRARTVTEKAICGSVRLSELDVALMKAYETARQDNFFIAGDKWDWQTSREKQCGGVADVVACVERATKDEIQQASLHADFDDGRQAVVDYYGGLYPIHSVTSDAMIAEITQNFAAHINRKVESCSDVIAMPVHRGRGDDEDWGAVCTVDFDGRKIRELICIRDREYPLKYMDVSGRSIGRREVAIFLYMNCERH